MNDRFVPLAPRIGAKVTLGRSDVLDPANADEINGKPHVPLAVRASASTTQDRGFEYDDQHLDQRIDVDAILREEERNELEARLGAALHDIPVGVVLVWRIDS